MNFWFVGVGEPLPVDGKNTRLRRIGNLVNYISDSTDNVDWFSVSFNHYEKKQRVDKSTIIEYKENYTLHISKVYSYKKNVSFQRIIHHIDAAKQIKKMMKNCERIPDIIVTGNTPIEVANMVTAYGKENNIPVIVDIRDLWPDVFKDSVPKKFENLITPYVKYSEIRVKKVMKRAAGIVALSNSFLEKGLTQADREKGEKDKVITMGYPNYVYDTTEEDFIKYWSKYGLKSDDFIIAFTGNFGRQFKFVEIIEVAKTLEKYSNIKFVLCGLGENLEKIKKEAPNNIVFPGWVEKNEIITLLNYSSLGIAPYIDSINFRSNTPNKFGEYLSASLPILVGVTGEMKNILEDNESGSYYSDNESLQQAILNYFYDKDLLYTTSERARKLYLSSFDGEKTSFYYKNHLESVVKNIKK